MITNKHHTCDNCLIHYVCRVHSCFFFRTSILNRLHCIFFISTYDEPLALMLLRFETLKLWEKPGKGESELVRLGAVILRKLLQMTQKVGTCICSNSWSKHLSAGLLYKSNLALAVLDAYVKFPKIQGLD